MCSSWLDLGFLKDINHPEAWATIVDGILAALGTVLSVAIAAYLTYRYTRKHSDATHNTAIRVDRLRRDIDALESLWELLVYMSLGESEQAIVRWREDRQQGVNKHYFVHYGNLQQFVLKHVSEVFYQRHAGLHLPAHIRDQLFEYKGSLMGLYFRYKDEYDDSRIAENPLILLDNPNPIEKLRCAYDNLNEDLKTELETRYQQLSARCGKVTRKMLSPNSAFDG